MPLYEYKCKKCGHRFELIQSFSAEDAKDCPVCHGEVERLISTPARAHFKGSGFYSTDYGTKSGGSSSSDSGSANASGSSEKPSTPKTETAPAPAASSTSSKADSGNPG
jgi:putative FmdB family regulatory protein